MRERLSGTRAQLRRVRATERVLAEQVAHLDEVVADAQTRRLVARTPLADRQWADARQDRDRHAAQLEGARQEVATLLGTQDDLLDRLLQLQAATRRRETR